VSGSLIFYLHTTLAIYRISGLPHPAHSGGRVFRHEIGCRFRPSNETSPHARHWLIEKLPEQDKAHKNES
jgi:hypothetical protein